MMQVKMLTSLAGPNFSYQPGQIVKLSDRIGGAMCEDGRATQVLGEEAANHEIEVITAQAAEAQNQQQAVIDRLTGELEAATKKLEKAQANLKKARAEAREAKQDLQVVSSENQIQTDLLAGLQNQVELAMLNPAQAAAEIEVKAAAADKAKAKTAAPAGDPEMHPDGTRKAPPPADPMTHGDHPAAAAAAGKGEG